MTYRGVYRDGIVILQGDVDLLNGASVEVNSAPPAKAKARRGSKGTKPKVSVRSGGAKTATGKSESTKRAFPGTGIWKDRWPKSMNSAEIARALRDEVSRRTR